MSSFHGHSVVTVEDDIVLFKFIESINVRDAEDMVVDKLKGDVTLSIRTTSGKEHIVSMNRMWDVIGGGTIRGQELASSICEKWLWINKP